MGYSAIWKKHKNKIIAMAAFVAWLWFFPLFGIMQTALEDVQGKMTYFNLVFLGSTVLGYLAFLAVKRREAALNILIAAAAPLAAGSTGLVAFLDWQFSAEILSPWGLHAVAMFILLPLFMGFGGAIFFAFWGTTIYDVPIGERGRYMAAMVIVATMLYTALVLLFYRAPLAALFLSAFFLLFPSLNTKTAASFMASDQPGERQAKGGPPVFTSTNAETSEENLKPWKAFWFPFALTIFCFYILAWEAHGIVFTVIKEENTFLPIIGQAIYALTFLFAGYYLDREKEIEKMAIFGLVVLGCSFLLFPVALPAGALWPLYALLEASYGFIDLFMWVSLAYFCQLLRGDPRSYYARGLLLNIFFIMIGIILMPLLTFSFEGEGYYILSLAAGIILFVGILPALSLRKLRLTGHTTVGLSDIIDQEMGRLTIQQDLPIDHFTQKEKEILVLLLADQKNPEIAEKLGISKNTLKTHIRNIYGKALVKNRSELLFKFAELKKELDY